MSEEPTAVHEDEESEEEEEEEESTVDERCRKECPPPRPACFSRIEQLSQPKRWNLLGTYKHFGHLFEERRVQALKERVQELFCMSPEETELYFSTLQQRRRPGRIDVKALRRRMRKEKAAARKEAYHVLYVLLKKAMRFAYKNPPPLLMTPVLRLISDKVLELLAELHGTSVPKRTDTDHLSTFLLAVSDWAAIFASDIYYRIEVENRDDTARMRQLERDRSDDDERSSSTTTSSSSTTEKQTKVTGYEDGYEAEEASETEEGEGEAKSRSEGKEGEGERKRRSWFKGRRKSRSEEKPSSGAETSDGDEGEKRRSKRTSFEDTSEGERTEDGQEVA